MGRPAGWMKQLTGIDAMRSPGAPALRREIERQFWVQIATGITSERAAEAVGVSQAVGSRWFRHRGGMPLFMSKPVSGRYLELELEAVPEKLCEAQGDFHGIDNAGPDALVFVSVVSPIEAGFQPV